MQKDKIERYKTMIFYLIMAGVFCAYILMELICPPERQRQTAPEELYYEGSFLWEKEDGTEQEIEVPGRYEVEPGETMTIKTVLPEDYTAGTLAIRSSLQDVSFYVDGELRTVYDTKDTRPFGKNSASRYVFCETSAEDAGKTVEITLTTHTDQYSGVVNAVYNGDRTDIWEQLFSQYGQTTMIGFFVLFAGIITVIFSIALEITYRIRLDMEYLGWCMILGAVWMLGESKFRQLIVPNASVLASLCFVSILLCPVPILSYIDSVQQKRYSRIYLPIELTAFANFFVCTLLQVAGAADYIETLPMAHIILGVSMFAVLAATGKDILEGKAKEYRIILIGILVAMAAVAVESVSAYFVVSVTGYFMTVGLMVLLVMTTIRTVKNMHDMEQVKRQREEESLDFLTGLPMRMRGEKEIAGKMQSEDGCLILFDMDNLKRVNDIYGHKAGDRVLRVLGELMKNVSVTATGCRLGGDEFLLFLSGSGREEAVRVTQKIFREFTETKEKDIEIRSATLSAGLCRSKSGDSFEECYTRADKALYYVKQNGKNHFAFYQELEEQRKKESAKQADLDLVVKALQESGTYAGALDLDYRDFAKLFEYMKSLGDRYRHTCYLIMITMEAAPDQHMYMEGMEEALECMGKAVRKNIRKVDICTRYSSMQYLVILMEAGEPNIPDIMERIFSQYGRLYTRNDFTPQYEFRRMMEDNTK